MLLTFFKFRRHQLVFGKCWKSQNLMKELTNNYWGNSQLLNNLPKIHVSELFTDSSFGVVGAGSRSRNLMAIVCYHFGDYELSVPWK
jgi:hypothetical protein